MWGRLHLPHNYPFPPVVGGEAAHYRRKSDSWSVCDPPNLPLKWELEANNDPRLARLQLFRDRLRDRAGRLQPGDGLQRDAERYGDARLLCAPSGQSDRRRGGNVAADGAGLPRTAILGAPALYRD